MSLCDAWLGKKSTTDALLVVSQKRMGVLPTSSAMPTRNKKQLKNKGPGEQPEQQHHDSSCIRNESSGARVIRKQLCKGLA